MVDDYTDFAKKVVKLPPPKPYGGARKRPYPRDKAHIQGVFRRNRCQAVRSILEAQAERCGIEAKTLAEHFCPESSINMQQSIFNHPNPAAEPPDLETLTCLQVWTKLRKCENTAPGPGRITYAHWKQVDPGARTLTAIYNLCLKFKRVPPDWKRSMTILIPKTDKPTDVSQWRPISLCSTIAKLYAACLARTIQDWAEENGIIDNAQKGFRPYDGAFENNYVVQSKIQNAKMQNKEICLISLDISNAFGSVRHDDLIDAIRKSGAGEHVAEIITDLYNGAETCLMYIATFICHSFIRQYLLSG